MPDTELNAMLNAPEPFGPLYPSIPSAAKFRKVVNPTPLERSLHGRTVLEAIRKMQAAALRREAPSVPKLKCASGTELADGADIHAAIRREHSSQLRAAVNRSRDARTDEEVREAYEDVMQTKRGALALSNQ